MDAIKTKEELTADKATLDSKMATLLTQDGAEAFIVDEIAKIDRMLPMLTEKSLSSQKVSMKTFLTTLKALLANAPVKMIEAEMARTEKQQVEVEAELKVVDAEIKAVDVIGEIEPLGKEAPEWP